MMVKSPIYSNLFPATPLRRERREYSLCVHVCVCVYVFVCVCLTILDFVLLSRLLHVHRGLPHGVWTKGTALVLASERSHRKTVLDLFLPHVWSRDWPAECLSEERRWEWRVPLMEKTRWAEHLLAASADWIQLWEATPGKPEATRTKW